jgi:hypothetical protein
MRNPRGSPGTVRLSSYERRTEAETAERRTIKRRLQHGYYQIRKPPRKTSTNVNMDGNVTDRRLNIGVHLVP